MKIAKNFKQVFFEYSPNGMSGKHMAIVIYSYKGVYVTDDRPYMIILDLIRPLLHRDSV